jgi:hypothetical protein
MTAEEYDPDNLLLLGLHLNGMIEGPGGDLSASPYERFKGPRPTRKVDNLDVNCGVFEIAQPLGDRHGSVLQECPATDGHPYRQSF